MFAESYHQIRMCPYARKFNVQVDFLEEENDETMHDPAALEAAASLLNNKADFSLSAQVLV